MGKKEGLRVGENGGYGWGKGGKVNSGIMGKGGKGEKVSDGKRVKVKGGKREGLRVVEERLWLGKKGKGYGRGSGWKKGARVMGGKRGNG